MSANRHWQFFVKMKKLSTQYQFLAIDNATIALADLSLLDDLHPEEELPALYAEKLSTAEMHKLTNFSYKKRYAEWLGGRLAAKYGLELFRKKTKQTPLAPNTVSILADEHGRPYLETEFSTPLSISISHSKGYAAAYVSPKQSCGIDIQQVTSKMLNVAEKFTTETEKSLFRDSENHLLTLTIIWVAKEAVKKSLLHDQPITFKGTKVVKVETTGAGAWKMHCDVTGNCHSSTTVKIATFNDFVIGCTEGQPYA